MNAGDAHHGLRIDSESLGSRKSPPWSVCPLLLESGRVNAPLDAHSDVIGLNTGETIFTRVHPHRGRNFAFGSVLLPRLKTGLLASRIRASDEQVRGI